MAVYRLTSTDPYHNLAVEESLLERLAGRAAAATGGLGAPVLLLWRNDPCVVIGRHQNPWVECDLIRMRCDGVPLVRRISGGGAVYHDRGNLNVSFIAPGELYSQPRHFGVAVAALARLGVEARVTARNDICVGDRKISGSAFRHTRGVSLHHLTLLVCADLDRLTAYLAAPPARIESRATASVRSRVVNLCDARPGIDLPAVMDAVEAAFRAEYGAAAAAAGAPPREDAPGIAERAGELAGWEWVYARTPAFSREHLGGRVRVAVRHGMIEAVEERGLGVDDETAASQTGVPTLRDTLVGTRYHAPDLIALAGRLAGAEALARLIGMLAKEID